MAVAVKPSPEATTSSPLSKLPVISLLGTLYLIGSLVLVFQVVPALWWSVWPGAAHTFSAWVLLGIVDLAVFGALVFGGARLLGERAPAGSRAGVFTAVVLLLAVVLVTRWIAGVLEGWIYEGGWFGTGGRTVGATFVSVLGVAMLLYVIRLFFKKGFQAFLVSFEEQGWFSGGSYKKLQGLKVRRATILGILLLIGAGVYTMVSHGTLRGGSPDWRLTVPFTGSVVVTRNSMGDLAALPAEEGTPLAQYQEWARERQARLKESLEWEQKAREWEQKRQQAAVDTPEYQEALKKAEEARKQAAETRAAADESRTIDRYVLRDEINPRLNPDQYVKIDNPEGFQTKFKDGQIVPKSEYEAEAKALRDQGLNVPDVREPRPVSGDVSYQSVTLLPNVQITLPLLLLAAGIWFAWRVVNVPAFGDFLIATEAEMNKVSWSSRRRLFQDTVVVLVTVLLLAGYLFFMDVLWQQLLSSRLVGVIRVSSQEEIIQKGADDRPLW